MKKIEDLISYLESERISPEQLAKRIKISNMTIRRLLTKDPQCDIPAKYAMQFQLLAANRSAKGFESILSNLETEGARITGLDQLRTDLDEKLGDKGIGAELRHHIKTVAKTAFNGKNKKHIALCLGALLYFINPLDIIPDALGPVGYLDDFAVLSLISTIVRHDLESSG